MSIPQFKFCVFPFCVEIKFAYKTELILCGRFLGNISDSLDRGEAENLAFYLTVTYKGAPKKTDL